jgi:DNA-binding CsgD family transcriptional regulator
MYWADSTGHRNASTLRSCDARARAASAGCSGPGADAIAWSPARGPAGGAAAVLGGDRTGLPSEDAAVVAGVSPTVGTRWFRQSGGMPPITQSVLSGRCLSLAEREEIAILRARGCGVREIARRAGRSASTISRELRRNAATRGGCLEYRATTAQWHAGRRARRPKAAKLAVNEPLRRYVEERLPGTVRRPGGACVEGPSVRWIGRRHGRRADRRWATAWSPGQIANRLRADFPDDDSMRISHEAI